MLKRLLRRRFTSPRKDVCLSLRTKCNEVKQSKLKMENLNWNNFQQFHHTNLSILGF